MDTIIRYNYQLRYQHINHQILPTLTLGSTALTIGNFIKYGHSLEAFCDYITVLAECMSFFSNHAIHRRRKSVDCNSASEVTLNYMGRIDTTRLPWNTTRREPCAYFLGVLHTAPKYSLNIKRPRKNYRHFADDIFKCILLNENIWISMKCFFPRVQLTISQSMVVRLPMHICVTRPQ